MHVSVCKKCIYYDRVRDSCTYQHDYYGKTTGIPKDCPLIKRGAISNIAEHPCYGCPFFNLADFSCSASTEQKKFYCKLYS